MGLIGNSHLSFDFLSSELGISVLTSKEWTQNSEIRRGLMNCFHAGTKDFGVAGWEHHDFFGTFFHRPCLEEPFPNALGPWNGNRKWGGDEL